MTSPTNAPPKVYRLKGGGFYHARCHLEASKPLGSPIRGRPIDEVLEAMPRPQCCSVCKGDGEHPLVWHRAADPRARP